jgi:hypothetical protein
VRAGAEFHERVLGPRQEARVGTVLWVIDTLIKERLAAGDTPRSDGFFEQREGREQPPAYELAEGVLLRAANEYEERKVPYIGALFASVAFRADIALPYANLLLRLADRLGYRQLQAIAFFAENAGSEQLARLEAERERKGGWWFANGVGVELDEAGDIGLFGIEQESGAVTHPRATLSSGGIESAQLSRIALTPLGRNLYELMELDRLPQGEKDRILDLIRAGH